jgi:hypothetical protein
MKIFFVLLIPLMTITSCCLTGDRKCYQGNNSAIFRILSGSNGQDLVFGPSGIYDKNLIKFYSINGIDTIFHYYGAGPNPNPGQDSLLFVTFDHRKKDTVYVLLNNSDTDTLYLKYQMVDGAPCCPDYSQIYPSKYNKTFLQTMSGGITIINK